LERATKVRSVAARRRNYKFTVADTELTVVERNAPVATSADDIDLELQPPLHRSA